MRPAKANAKLADERFWVGDGLQLAIERHGPEDGQPVILLHGGGQTRGSWKKTAQILGKAGYLVLAYEARGHGESDWAADGDYTLDAYSRDLGSVVRALGRAPLLVGASLGGLTAMTAIGNGSITAAGLVLVDVVAVVMNSGTERVRNFMSGHPDGFATVNDALTAVRAYRSDRSRPTQSSGSMERNLRQREDGRYHWHWDPRILWDDDQYSPVEVQAKLERAAQSLDLPVMLIRGAASDVVTEDGMARFRALVPHVQTVEIVAAGHMIVGDENLLVNRSLLAFFSGIQTPL